jgi:hypothetical protein
MANTAATNVGETGWTASGADGESFDTQASFLGAGLGDDDFGDGPKGVWGVFDGGT